MNLDSQNVKELVIGVATIAAAVFFVHMGYIGPEWGFGVVLAVASALTAYEKGRKQPQPE